jgi:CRP-like cAMP-binding protein
VAEISLFANEPSKRSLAAGETLFSAGDTAGHMYGVVTGAIDVVIGDTVVETVEAGGVLGEMAILDNSVRSATARASEDTVVAEIDQGRFLTMLRHNPFFSIEIMKVMTERLRRQS